jgi:hypothetical protein
MSTAQVLEWIADANFDLATQASRDPEKGYRGLANFREFKAAVLPRVTKASADGQTNKLRSLARKVVDQDEPPSPPKPKQTPGGVALNWQSLALIGGGLVVLVGLLVLVFKLIEIFGGN